MRRPKLVLLACLFLTRTAGAQAGDAAAAEVLFSEGRSAMQRRDYAVACARFAESQRLDPAGGTLINLAECLDKQGKLASSWEAWRRARQSLSGDDDRIRAVDERISNIEARVPRLTIVLPSGSPSDVQVLRNDVPIGPAALGLPLPVDPGKHVVRVQASGHEPREYPVEVLEGENRRLSVEPGPGIGAPGAKTKAPHPPARTGEEPVTAPSPPGDKSSSRAVGYVVGGAGIAALVAGGVAGVLAIDMKNEMDDVCRKQNGTLFCPPSGLDASDSGQTLATVSNVGILVGIAGVGLGAYFVLSSDSAPSSSTALGARPTPSGGTLEVLQTF